MNSSKESKQRIQLDMTDTMVTILDSMVRLSGASSRAEVIRRALSLYDALLREEKAGKRIEIVNPRIRRNGRLILRI